MAKEEKITSANAIEKWAKKHPKVMTWLSKIQRKKMSAWNLQRYCQTVEKTPDELLALKDDPRSREAEYLLDDFVANPPFTESVTYTINVAVKSFYKHNYRELAKASGMTTPPQKKKPYRKHTKGELLKIYRSTQNPRDRALITFTWSTSIAKESLTKIQWKHFEKEWKKQELPHIGLPDVLIKGHGRGKYKGVEQHTFLTPEAKKDLQDYVAWLDRTKGIKLGAPDDPVFIDLRYGSKVKPIGYASLGRLAMVLSQRSGVPFNWHDARRYVETALEEIKIHPNWARKIRGRKVRGEEAPYSRPAIEQLRRAYKEAVPLIEFTQPTKMEKADMEKIARKQVLLGVLKTLNITEKEAAAMFHGRWPSRNIDEEIEFMEMIIEAKRKERENNKDCPNGVDCGEQFEQIPEEKLLEYLRQGWQIVQRLSNGEVIVRR